MPIAKLPPEVIERILEGGASICREAGIPIAGGHSIDVLEPFYGLVALGLVHPDQVRRNADARAGDVLVLGKPLGVGVLSAASKKGILEADGYTEMLRRTTQLHRVGEALAHIDGLHAMTDVTGFGLAGHLLEICRGSGFSGIATGASVRNWAAYGDDLLLPEAASEWQRTLLTDPRTSGGFLVSYSEAAVSVVLEAFRAAGFAQAAVIGQMLANTAGQGSRLGCAL